MARDPGTTHTAAAAEAGAAAPPPSAHPADERGFKRWWSRLRKLGAVLKARRKELFWAWIAYQSVKGVITLSIIWIPLILVLWRGR